MKLLISFFIIFVSGIWRVQSFTPTNNRENGVENPDETFPDMSVSFVPPSSTTGDNIPFGVPGRLPPPFSWPFGIAPPSPGGFNGPLGPGIYGSPVNIPLSPGVLGYPRNFGNGNNAGFYPQGGYGVPGMHIPQGGYGGSTFGTGYGGPGPYFNGAVGGYGVSLYSTPLGGYTGRFPRGMVSYAIMVPSSEEYSTNGRRRPQTGLVSPRGIGGQEFARNP